MPTRKDVAVWISGYLTFLSILFTFDAFFFGGPNSLMKLYPLYAVIHSVFGDIDGSTYLWLTSISTFILFGITCTFVLRPTYTSDQEISFGSPIRRESNGRLFRIKFKHVRND